MKIFILFIFCIYLFSYSNAYSAGGEVNGNIYQKIDIYSSNVISTKKNKLSINSINNNGKIFGNVVQIYDSNITTNVDTNINKLENKGVVTGETIQKNNIDNVRIISK